ncbi:MAG TPA: glycosyltransferase [Clostridiaceae bacterium]|nr:glycosyltransferase [Clostridiaceae bacterium]
MMYFVIGFGILFCTFYVAQLVFVKIHLDWTNKIINSDNSDADTGVSVIHPIKDLDYELEKNLESWLNQDYQGPIQHIFSFQDPNDPAIKVVENLKQKYSDIDISIIVNPIASGLNGKTSNMVNGIKNAKYNYLLFGDSDTRVKRDFILKMIRPLKDSKVGVTTCGQINIGGHDFPTKFFTFIQNNETDFIWAFLCKLGMDVGITGAAFAMRKEVIEEIGGLERFGTSLLEDLYLGNTLYEMGYKIVLGPFIECHVDKLGIEKSLNYAKRIAIGIRTHIQFELPAFVLMLFWYWGIFIVGAMLQNKILLFASFVFMTIRTMQGLMMRYIVGDKIYPVDVFMGLFFDIFGTFYLLYAMKTTPTVTWRGIKYEVEKGGHITSISVDDSVLSVEEDDDE